MEVGRKHRQHGGQRSRAAATWDLTPQEAAQLGLETVRHHCLVSVLMACGTRRPHQ